MGTAAILAMAGCGNNYRPVVSAINPVGPSSQPSVLGVALSDPGNGQGGLITVFDVFGDTTIANATVAALPSYLAVDPLGESYVLHSNSVLMESFTAAAGLMTSTLKQSSFAVGAAPNQVYAASGTSPIYVTEPGLNQVSILTGGAPPTARQDIPIPLNQPCTVTTTQLCPTNPVYTVGLSAAARVYVLSQGPFPTAYPGLATAIENGTNNAVSANINVGYSPIYGVMTADTRRAFVVNKLGNGGSTGTISVINSQSNALDRTINVGLNPVWADLAPAINELVVLNQGDATTAGSISVINIALCNQVALASNTACDTSNPTDSANFGQVLGTVSVGKGPVQVAVLSDLSKAYIANATDGTVSVVDLNTMVKTTTINVGGKLNWIQAVAGNPTGKVFVTASDTQVMTVIRTDTDAIDTTIPLQGYGVSVRIAQ